MRFRHGYVHGCVHAGVGFSFAKLKPPLQPKAESPMADLVAAQNLLRSVFGFASFREGQAEIIETILAGRDVLAVMPTGSGKSLCCGAPRSACWRSTRPIASRNGAMTSGPNT